MADQHPPASADDLMYAIQLVADRVRHEGPDNRSLLLARVQRLLKLMVWANLASSPAARPEPPAAEVTCERCHAVAQQLLGSKYDAMARRFDLAQAVEWLRADHDALVRADSSRVYVWGMKDGKKQLMRAGDVLRAAVHAQEGPRDGKEAASTAEVQRESAAPDAGGASSMAEAAGDRANAQGDRGIQEAPALSAIRALIQQWREEADEMWHAAREAESKNNLIAASGLLHKSEMLRQCADQLAALCPAPAAEEDRR